MKMSSSKIALNFAADQTDLQPKQHSLYR